MWPPSTQNQAFNALFLYREVLHQDWGELGREGSTWGPRGLPSWNGDTTR